MLCPTEHMLKGQSNDVNKTKIPQILSEILKAKNGIFVIYVTETGFLPYFAIFWEEVEKPRFLSK